MFSVKEITSADLSSLYSSELYHILLFEGEGILTVDFTEYKFHDKIVYFASPYQHFKITTNNPFKISIIAFHGDFYCIEYHKKEVACNGLLFNNIFLDPFIILDNNDFEELFQLIQKLKTELNNNSPFSEPILKAYLQLILAIASKVKNQKIKDPITSIPPDNKIEQFKSLLEEHFLDQRQPSFYADTLALTPNVFTKKCKEYLRKTPSQVIQERVILEAKKLIHLTRMSFKEIATSLNFKDEHYFSRYFKKNTGVTPSLFREKVGVSIVADLSMN